MKRLLFVLVFRAFVFPLYAQEVLRGQVKIELEQVWGFTLDGENQHRILNTAQAKAEAVEEASRYYSAMIYGWSFKYDVGEKARNIEETLELSLLGIVESNDPRLETTDVQVKDGNLYLWSDYRPDITQLYRMAKWKAGSARSAQAYGQAPLNEKYAALEDAARAALRAMLRGSERNRPKEVTGYISLAEFPRYWIDKGQWSAFGRFRVEIIDIQPFAVH